MKNSLIKQCLDILKTEDVRNEIKVLFSPVTDLILYEISETENSFCIMLSVL